MERVLEVSNSTNSGSSDAGGGGEGVCAIAACVPKIKSRKDASFRFSAKSDMYLIPLSRGAQTKRVGFPNVMIFRIQPDIR